MAKPSSLPLWADDPTFTSGTENGTPVIVEPADPYKSQGYVPGNPWVGTYANWWQNLVYQWAQYLNDLPSESAFLSANFAWTGVHSFADTVAFNDAVTALTAVGNVFITAGSLDVSDNITADDTIFANNGLSAAAGNIVATLGNITASAGNITATLGDVIAGDDCTAGGDFTYNPQPVRTVMMPLCALPGSNWAFDPLLGDPGMVTATASAAVRIPIRVPHNCTLTRIRAGVTHGSGTGNVNFIAHRNLADTSAGTASSLALGATDSLAASGDGVLTTGTFSEIMNTATDSIVLTVYASSGAGSGTEDKVNWVEIQFTDAGPING